MIVFSLLFACTPTHGDTSPDSLAETAAPTACPAGNSDLDGVCIVFERTGATFTLAEAAAGVSIPYTVVVGEALEIVPDSQTSGNCGQPGPSGLIVFERLSGGDQGYCLCDSGLCADRSDPTTLVPGRHDATFAWDGRNWTGPSDYGNPEGAPFPAGSYTLEVSAVGTVHTAPFRVANTFAVTLVR